MDVNALVPVMSGYDTEGSVIDLRIDADGETYVVCADGVAMESYPYTTGHGDSSSYYAWRQAEACYRLRRNTNASTFADYRRNGG